MAGNIWKARVIWGRLERVLGREGAHPKVSRSFYTAVTQQVLLFGAESWVLTKNMESALDAFQGRVARRLIGRQLRRGRDGECFYSSLAGDLKEAGVVRARTSVLRRQNMVAQFIAARPILGLCKMAERRRGTRVPQRWWEKLAIGWRLAREKAVEVQAGENEAAPETPGSGSESESDPDPTPEGTAGDTREEASLGVSGSSGAGWSGVED